MWRESQCERKNHSVGTGAAGNFANQRHCVCTSAVIMALPVVMGARFAIAEIPDGTLTCLASNWGYAVGADGAGVGENDVEAAVRHGYCCVERCHRVAGAAVGTDSVKAAFVVDLGQVAIVCDISRWEGYALCRGDGGGTLVAVPSVVESWRRCECVAVDIAAGFCLQRFAHAFQCEVGIAKMGAFVTVEGG